MLYVGLFGVLYHGYDEKREAELAVRLLRDALGMSRGEAWKTVFSLQKEGGLYYYLWSEGLLAEFYAMLESAGFPGGWVSDRTVACLSGLSRAGIVIVENRPLWMIEEALDRLGVDPGLFVGAVTPECCEGVEPLPSPVMLLEAGCSRESVVLGKRELYRAGLYIGAECFEARTEIGIERVLERIARRIENGGVIGG